MISIVPTNTCTIAQAKEIAKRSHADLCFLEKKSRPQNSAAFFSFERFREKLCPSVNLKFTEL